MNIFFLSLFFTNLFANSHVESAERKVTSIKMQAEKISTHVDNFYFKPNIPRLFYTYQVIHIDMKKLEMEIFRINSSID